MLTVPFPAIYNAFCKKQGKMQRRKRLKRRCT